MNNAKLLLLTLVLMLFAAACGDSDGADSSTTTTGSLPTDATSTSSDPSTDPADLVGTEWIVDRFLVDGVQFDLVPDADPTIRFAPDGPEIGGTTGCNSYFASIDYGPAGEVTIGLVGQTEMACFPDEVMVQEQQFTQALPAVRFYEIDGDRLTLVSEDGAVEITAVNRDSVALPRELGDVVWVADTRLERDAASTLVLGADVTLRFDIAAGNLGGSSGCNQFGAMFVVDDDRIRIESIEATQQACEDAVMEQERFLYDVLTNAATFEIDDNRLTIVTSDGRGISLVAGDPT